MKTTKQHPLKTSLVYPLDSFDRLSSFLPGNKTDNLIKKTSENIVRCGIRVYRIIREIQKQLPAITHEDIKDASSVLLKAQLRGRGLSEASKKFKNEFKAKLPVVSSKVEMLLSKDISFSRQIAFGKLLKPRHRPPDSALHILVIYLREHLKANRYRPHNELICNFLSEQGITEKITPDRISKLAAKFRFEELRKSYQFFHEVYEAPDILSPDPVKEHLRKQDPDLNWESLLCFIRETRRIAVDKPSDHDPLKPPPDRDMSLFPSWNEFMPQYHDDNSLSL